MSRKPAKTLIESETQDAGPPAVMRLHRAVADGGARSPLSLTLEAGASHFLTGDAGSGKTAILEMVALARPPARGGLELFERDAATIRPENRFALRRRIGVVFQDLRLIDDMSAFDNIALAARAAGRDMARYGNEINELLSWVGLGRRLDDLARDFDDEGRRRLAVARAVINRPELILADEPAGAAGLSILKLLSDLNRAGTTVLIATRDRELAEKSGAGHTHLAGSAR